MLRVPCLSKPLILLKVDTITAATGQETEDTQSPVYLKTLLHYTEYKNHCRTANKHTKDRKKEGKHFGIWTVFLSPG